MSRAGPDLPFTTIEAAALETAVRPSEARPVSGRTLRSNVRERRWLSMQAVQARDLPGKRLRSGQARSLRSAALRSRRRLNRSAIRTGVGNARGVVRRGSANRLPLLANPAFRDSVGEHLGEQLPNNSCSRNRVTCPRKSDGMEAS